VTTPAADAPASRPTGPVGWLLANLMPIVFVAAVVGVIVW